MGKIREVLEGKLKGSKLVLWQVLSEEGKKAVEKILDDFLPKVERTEAVDQLAADVEKQYKEKLEDRYRKYGWEGDLHNFLGEIRGIKCHTLSGIDYLDQDVKALSQCTGISVELKNWLANPENLKELRSFLDKHVRNEWGFLWGIWRGDPIHNVFPCQGA